MKAALLAALALAGVALAHSLLAEATPAPDATVKRLPTSVQLVLSEPVEMTFSAFKVYPLKSKDLAAAKREAANLFKPALEALLLLGILLLTGFLATTSPPR